MMTRTKLLEVARRRKGHRGYKVSVREVWKYRSGRGQVLHYQVELDPGIGFPTAWEKVYATENQGAACEARDRFWMWLRAEGLTRGEE